MDYWLRQLGDNLVGVPTTRGGDLVSYNAVIFGGYSGGGEVVVRGMLGAYVDVSCRAALQVQIIAADTL